MGSRIPAVSLPCSWLVSLPEMAVQSSHVQPVKSSDIPQGVRQPHAHVAGREGAAPRTQTGTVETWAEPEAGLLLAIGHYKWI